MACLRPRAGCPSRVKPCKSKSANVFRFAPEGGPSICALMSTRRTNCPRIAPRPAVPARRPGAARRAGGGTARIARALDCAGRGQAGAAIARRNRSGPPYIGLVTKAPRVAAAPIASSNSACGMAASFCQRELSSRVMPRAASLGVLSSGELRRREKIDPQTGEVR